jgi:hypothetical protein
VFHIWPILDKLFSAGRFEVEGCWVVGVELDDIFGFGGLCEEGGYSEEVEEEIYLAVFE